MKFATIEEAGSYRLGIISEHKVLDLSKALQQFPAPEMPADIMEIIANGNKYVPIIESYLRKMKQEDLLAITFEESQVSFGPCVTRPGKIICIGLNYRKHAVETNAAIPQYPILFNKFNNTLTGHHKEISLPNRVTSQVDYEAELVIVIGKKAKYVAREQALNHVFGYCCVNDLSARDLQMRTQQWLLGKSCDGFSPLGPYLVTADEVGDPNQLSIMSTVNGEVRQQSHTSDMIFPCDEIVSYISQHMTLDPGDIILTGTPEGVVLGRPEAERVYLNHGDIVTIEIEKLGVLANRMVDEQSW